MLPRQVWASAWVGACQARGVASEASNRSIDITRTPRTDLGGSTASPVTVRGRPLTPSILAIVGPFRSASMTPTCQPLAARHEARLAVTVDFPTPPLPES